MGAVAWTACGLIAVGSTAAVAVGVEAARLSGAAVQPYAVVWHRSTAALPTLPDLTRLAPRAAASGAVLALSPPADRPHGRRR